MRKLIFLAFAAVLTLCISGANAQAPEQAPVTTHPGNFGPGGTVVGGGTIASTGTFQLALAANGSRKGCIIQNQSTGGNVMEVATTSAGTDALIIGSGTGGAGNTFNCQAFVASLGDPLYITGTGGDAFVVWYQ